MLNKNYKITFILNYKDIFVTVSYENKFESMKDVKSFIDSSGNFSIHSDQIKCNFGEMELIFDSAHFELLNKSLDSINGDSNLINEKTTLQTWTTEEAFKFMCHQYGVSDLFFLTQKEHKIVEA